MAWTRQLRGKKRGQTRCDWYGQHGDALRFGVKTSPTIAGYTWRAQCRDRPEDTVVFETFVVDAQPVDSDGKVTIIFELDTSGMEPGETYVYDVEYEAPGALGPTTILGGIIRPDGDVTRATGS